jgi:hypothetical protein
MFLRKILAIFIAAAFCLTLFAAPFACVGSSGGDGDEDDEEPYVETPTLVDELEKMTGYPWSLDEGDIGAESPRGWEFLFAIQLSQELSEIIDGDWSVDFDEVEDRMATVGSGLKKEGLDLTKIDDQVVMAKVHNIEGETRLHFATKLTFDGDVMAVDQDSVDLLGDGIGSRGSGWYAVFYSTVQNGFITGSVAPCAGVEVSDILVTAPGTGFYTRPAPSGRFALPAAQEDENHLSGRPLVAVFQADECVGMLPYAMTDSTLFPNPKCETAGAPNDCITAQSLSFDDGTTVAAAQFINLADDGFTPPAAQADCVNCDFENGDASGWEYIAVGESETTQGCFGVADTAYEDLFPGGGESYYAFITTGGEGLRSCAAYRSLTVPEDASEIVIRYDFATQEYPDFSGSAYTDVFTAFVVGEFDPIIERTATDQALVQDFIDMPQAAQTIAGIAESTDASYSEGGAVFNAHLRYGESDDSPRGAFANDHIGQYASWSVTPGQEITIVFVISDVGDAYWDSAALIDSVSFQ